MTLSINKLAKILRNKSWLVKKTFSISDLCVYIEILHIDTGQRMFLYIPSKYDIETHDAYDNYTLHYLEISENGDITTDYADDDQEKDDYAEIDIDNSERIKNRKNIEVFLTDNYKCPISLKEISRVDTHQLKEIFRQLKRLKYCVEDIGYKICIIYKCYLCVIRRDNTFDFFSIENLTIDNQRKFIITTDLETLYEDINLLHTNCCSTYNGILDVLDRNQNKNLRNIKKMIEYKNNFVLLSSQFKTRRNKLNIQLKKLQKLLLSVNKSENRLQQKKITLEEKFANKISITDDMYKNNIIHNLDKNITTVRETKLSIIKGIFRVNSMLENLLLKVDQICFDNIVMFSTVMKNFEELTKI